MSACNIVVEWLRSLRLAQYADSFLDNGYDDLEICKQVGDPDLDAIGVLDPAHRARLLHSVRTLRHEGAASVYFSLEESACTGTASSGTAASGTACDSQVLAVPTSAQDDYEEGKAELLKIPRLQLKALLKQRIAEDGVRLACQPYSTACGDRGYLEGLASRYADLFNTHYVDVLQHLEELRRAEWQTVSARICVLESAGPQAHHGLTSSLSQPIYVPGKYSPSSCLSDKEEDEIYGFGYGVYGRHMVQHQQLHQHQHQLHQHQLHQSCLSPRSAYFYEFPPNDPGATQHTNKKKSTSFSRFLRGLKAAHRKDKHSPRHARLRDAGTESTADTVTVDPRDYDRLRFLQINGATTNSFEETIHRLKLQEVLKKRERFNKEHEEILRDIRQGLLQVGRDAGRGPMPRDDTYMYDDDARGPHWYDEPPYESDPEDFLMSGQPVPTATIQNGRVCFTLNLRQTPRGEGVISLPTAGDISVPRERDRDREQIITKGSGPWVPGVGAAMRRTAGGTIIGLHHHGTAPVASAHRESGDYASSDMQSVGSRLSTMSIETTRSEQTDTAAAVTGLTSPCYLAKGAHLRKLSRSSASEEGLSASHSSDYEDQEDLQTVQHVTVHATESGGHSGVSLVGRMRGLRQEVHRKMCKLQPVGTSADVPGSECQNLPCTSSAESLPSGSGSSTQALVPAGSNHSSLSAEDGEFLGPPIGRARALVDYTPSPYDKDALRFKKGDIIDIVAMNPSGLWKGVLHNRLGTFKFINVEVLAERTRPSGRQRATSKAVRGKPRTVEELLKRINLEEHISVFVLNGYEDVQLFKELDTGDLDYLGISQPEHRAKILTAVQLLHDYDSPDSPDDTDADGPASSSDEGGDDVDDDNDNDDNKECRNSSSSFRRLHFPRDSGCYDGTLKERSYPHQKILQGTHSECSANRELPNNLDSHAGVLTASGSDGCEQQVPALTSSEKGANSAADTLQQQQQQQNFLPNIPVTSASPCRRSPVRTVKQQQEVLLEFPSTVDIPCCEVIEDSCETDPKLTLVKYVVGVSSDLGLGCESANVVTSEKSSDSGVSSSSVSSGKQREVHSNASKFLVLPSYHQRVNTHISEQQQQQ